MTPDFFPQYLARWQFGMSLSFHFLFVPLSLGLLLGINILQTAHAMSRRLTLARAAAFWSRILLLVWATGMITGYPLRWQLSDHWAYYLHEAEPVLTRVFAIEGAILWPMILAMLAITWLRGWLASPVLALIGWLLLAVMSVQAWTILSVNAWMQNPGQLTQIQGRWQVQSVWQLLLSEMALHKLTHTLAAAMLSGAFFIFALAGLWQRLRRHASVARVSVGVAVWIGFGAALAVLLSGHMSASGVAKLQPLKFAAFEAHWRNGHVDAPLVLWARPEDEARINRDELAIAGLMGLLIEGQEGSPAGLDELAQELAWLELAQQSGGKVEGVAGITPQALQALRPVVAQRYGLEKWATLSAAERAQAVAQAAAPPVAVTFYAFRAMVASGLICLALTALAFLRRRRLREGRLPGLMRALVWAAPLPWIAILCGWVVAEVGRQPWVIYGRFSVHQAASIMHGTRGGELNLLQMSLAGAAISSVFIVALRSILLAGPDRAHWLDARHLWATAPAATNFRAHVRRWLDAGAWRTLSRHAPGWRRRGRAWQDTVFRPRVQLRRR